MSDIPSVSNSGKDESIENLAKQKSNVSNVPKDANEQAKASALAGGFKKQVKQSTTSPVTKDTANIGQQDHQVQQKQQEQHSKTTDPFQEPFEKSKQTQDAAEFQQVLDSQKTKDKIKNEQVAQEQAAQLGSTVSTPQTTQQPVSDVSATTQAQPTAGDESIKRSEMIQKLQVSARQLQVSSDNTSMHVTLQNSVLPATSFVLTTAANGAIAVTFATASAQSEAFLQRNVDKMMSEVANELGVEVKMVVRHHDGQDNQEQHQQSQANS